MSGAYEPTKSRTNATFSFRCRWKAYGSSSCAAQLTSSPAVGQRVDRSVQTDARARPVRPDVGAGSVASRRSGHSPEKGWHEPRHHQHVRGADPEGEQEVGEGDADRDVDRRGQAVAGEDTQVGSIGEPFGQS